MSNPRPVSPASLAGFASCAALVSCFLFAPVPAAGSIAGEEPCSLTCAADLTVANDPGSCDAAVDYPSPIILGVCGPIVCTPPVGTFPLGPTTVTCAELTQATGSRGGDLLPLTAPTATTGPVPGASCTFDVTVVDTEPPAIVCPADLSVVAPIGGSTAIVDYPFPQLSDNCLEIETPTCVPASGAAFPIGDTTATCSTADGAGNAASCTFVVSVTGGSPLEVPSLTPRGLALLAVLLAAAALLVLRGR